MAERDAGAKLHIYYTLYRLNLSFANIVTHCRALGESRVLAPKFTKLYESYTQELQAEINEDVVSAMDEIELRDMHRFGKARAAREKELRDPDDVFIHAEERCKELAKQGKTPPVLKSARKRTPERRNPSRPRRKEPISLGG
jgi:hypothetical protein